MWESPVNIYETLSDMVEKEIDGNIIVEIKRQLGIDINKEELIRAINYDRNQYEKGYQDGLNANRWIPCSERLPEEKTTVLISCEDYYLRNLNPCIGWRNGQYWHTFTANGCEQIWYPIAWMPLPEPFKVESEET